jgi:hypothetical protein
MKKIKFILYTFILKNGSLTTVLDSSGVDSGGAGAARSPTEF